MKKFTILAAMALTAVASQAQYTCDPSTDVVIKDGVKNVYFLVLADGAIKQLEADGVKCYNFTADETQGRNLWYWNGLIPADETTPRVDMEEGGYVSVQVTGEGGWSGAGFNAQAPGLDLSSFTDDTHFHMAYMTPTGNAPSSVECTLLDNTTATATPFKFAIGEAGNDNGVVIPSIAPKATDDWNGIDITFAQMKKLFPTFALDTNPAWTGNYFTWLAGSVAGQTIAFDAIYFWNGEEAGVADIVANDLQFVQTGKTLNVMGGKGIELYNLAGALVKSSNSTAVGLENLAAGIYVAKSGSLVKKIVVE